MRAAPGSPAAALLVLATVSSLGSGCRTPAPAKVLPDPPATDSPSPDSTDPPATDSPVVPNIAEVREAADRGDYLRALELIEQDLGKGQSESYFSEPYARSINGLLERAEREHMNHEPRTAGLLFRMTLDHFPRSASVREKIAMDATEIEAAVDVCADDLLALGLTAYRAGQLQRAIDIWTQIQEFHRDHDQSQQAIRTTRVQLKNLRELGERDEGQ